MAAPDPDPFKGQAAAEATFSLLGPREPRSRGPSGRKLSPQELEDAGDPEAAVLAEAQLGALSPWTFRAKQTGSESYFLFTNLIYSWAAGSVPGSRGS